MARAMQLPRMKLRKRGKRGRQAMLVISLELGPDWYDGSSAEGQEMGSG